MKKMAMLLIPFMFTLMMVFFGSTTAFGVKPPWAGDPDLGPKDPPPPHPPSA